jgi:hypothetical protein
LHPGARTAFAVHLPGALLVEEVLSALPAALARASSSVGALHAACLRTSS